MNPCVKTEEKCNESVNNEFKIIRKRDSLYQAMRVSEKIMKQTHRIHLCLIILFNSLL